jgi:hypothetical protein
MTSSYFDPSKVLVVEVKSAGPQGIGLPPGSLGDVGKYPRLRRTAGNPYDYELVTPDAVGLPQGLATTSSPTFAGLTLSGQASSVVRLVVVGANGQLVSLAIGTNLAIVDGALVAAGGSGGSGGYPSLTMPTGFSVAGNTTASLVVTFATGYSLPTNTRQGLWDTAYSERLYWDGSNTGLNAVAGRASLGLGTAAQSATTDFASAAQGALAATAVQPATLTAGLAGKTDLVGGPVPTSQIPSVAVVEYLGQAANQAAMLALRGQGGDWCIRTDSSTEWVIIANNGATLSDWIQLPNGISPVSSINGQTGAVTLGTGDLGESGGNLFFTASRAIGSALTGFVAGAGAVAATDSILQAINKIVGNIAAKTQVSSTAPAALAATAAAGSSTDAARADHAHQRDTEVIVIPVGDESTALTTGTNKVRFRMPYAATLLSVRANVNTTPTGSTLIVDINEAGTSVLGTKLSIDATETSSTTAASAATITDSSLADDAEISIDIDQIGSTVAGAGLKVSLFVRRA